VRPGRPFRQAAGAGAIVFDAGPGGNLDLVMLGAHVVAAAAAATVVIREVDGAGAIIAELAAVVNGNDELTIPVIFKKALHVTVTGAGASCIVYV